MKQKSVKQNGGFENQIKTKGGWLNLSLISGVTASKKKSMMAKKIINKEIKTIAAAFPADR